MINKKDIMTTGSRTERHNVEILHNFVDAMVQDYGMVILNGNPDVDNDLRLVGPEEITDVIASYIYALGNVSCTECKFSLLCRVSGFLASTKPPFWSIKLTPDETVLIDGIYRHIIADQCDYYEPLLEDLGGPPSEESKDAS